MSFQLKLDPTTGIATLTGLTVDKVEGAVSQEDLALILEKLESIEAAMPANSSIGFSIVVGEDEGGDIYYRDNEGKLERLPIGEEGQILSIEDGFPAWKNSSGSGGNPSIFDIEGLPFSLQQRNSMVARNFERITQAGSGQFTLFEREIYRGDYSENACLEMYALFALENTDASSSLSFSINNQVISIAYPGNASAFQMEKRLFLRNSFNSQVAINAAYNGNIGADNWSGNGTTAYSINMEDSFTFRIASSLQNPSDIIYLDAAFLRINY